MMASKNQTSKRDNSPITDHLHQGHGQPSPVNIMHPMVQCDEMGTAPLGPSPQITRKHQRAQIRSQPKKYLIGLPKCHGHQRESEVKLFQTIGDNGTKHL